MFYFGTSVLIHTGFSMSLQSLLTTGKYTMGRVYHNLLNRSLGVSHLNDPNNGHLLILPSYDRSIGDALVTCCRVTNYTQTWQLCYLP